VKIEKDSITDKRSCCYCRLKISVTPKMDFLWSTAATVFEANKFPEFVLCYISNALQELKQNYIH
jgi:hypothetical protein